MKSAGAKRMRDGAYLKRLEADLARWTAAGRLSGEQSQALLADAHARAAKGQGSFANVAAAMGAVLFGLGLITFVAANWGELPKAARLGVSLLLPWLAFAAAVRAIERAAAGVGQAFALIGALSIGAAIAMIGQTYNIEGSAAGLFLVWSLAVLAASLVFSARPLLILFVILAFLYFVFDRPGDFFLAHGPSTRPSLSLFGAYYLALLFAGAFLARRWDSGAAMHLSGLSALVWTVLLFGDAIWLGRDRDWTAAGLMIAGAGALYAAAGEVFRARGERAGAIGLAWGAAAVLVGVIAAEFSLWEDKKVGVEMVFAAAVLGMTVWAINWGDAPGRRAVRGLAVALFAFECFYIYAALFQGLLDTSLFLLGGGALLIALASGWRWLTRKQKPLAPEAAP
jgi:uncharacterized membrane protein